MRIVPVLDVLNGVVVRGVGGRRAEYRPLQSRLTSSCDPRDVARALAETFDLAELYVADLDGILQQRPHHALYAQLAASGVSAWVDPGLRTADDGVQLLAAGADVAVAGLESLASADVLRDLLQRLPAERVLFSLDLQAGRPLAGAGWRGADPREIAAAAVAAGVQRLLVLDLADVGCSTGGRTDALLQHLRTTYPHVQLVAGGGVRGVEDLQRYADLGVDAVLVASALHDGRLTPADVARFRK